MMTKDTLKGELFKFSDAVKKRTAEVNVMLVDQNNQRRQKYHGLMLKTKVEDIQAVVEKSFEYIEQELNGRTLDIYDLEISVDESTQMVKKEDVIHGDEILDQLSVEYSESNTVTESTDLSRIKFMVLQVYEDGKSLYLFKKYIQPTTAYKTTEKYILSGGVLKPFIDEVITISSMVDAFLLNDVYYVFSRNSFNSIFAYKDVFKKILEDNSKMIKDCGLMTDAAQFIADCESDGRYLTRLTKAILAKGFEEVAKKKDGISKIVKDFNLSLTISESGKIAYKGKNDIPEVLNLILRHYVIDALTSTKMIAAAIQEYQAGIKGGTTD
jgi:hypothetical protein